MSDDEFEFISSQLRGKRDIHTIAHIYNWQCRHGSEEPPAVPLKVRKLANFRKLGLIEKRPGQEKRRVAEAEHILTERGIAFAKSINKRLNLALAVPAL